MHRARALMWIGLAAGACGGGASGGADAALGRADAAGQPADAAGPPADAAPADAGGPCVADTPAALVACGAAVQDGLADTIEVQGVLVCAGADACRLHVENAPRAYVIRGAPGSVIRREDHYDYDLLAAVGPADVTFQDLVIDERADAACQPILPVNPPVENPDCRASINVFGADHVVVDHVTIAHAKSQAVLITMAPHIRVSRARLVDAHEFGLQVSNLSGSLLVEDTLVWHSASNGVVLYDVHGTDADPALVRRSLLEHNHLNSIFYVCGDTADQPCGGGQLLLAGMNDFIRVEQSVIRTGANDFFPDIAIGGVELNPPFHDLAFAENDIHDHGMWGIYMNSSAEQAAAVVVTDNKLYDNGQAMFYDGVNVGNFGPDIVTETGTCGTPTCGTVGFGAVWATAADGVSWTSNDLASPQVTVDGVVVSTDPSGVIEAARGADVVLRDGTTEIDRLSVP